MVEERQAAGAEGVDQQRAVEEAVAGLAGGLGREQAGMAGRAVQRARTGLVLGAERVGATEPRVVERLVEIVSAIPRTAAPVIALA